ncbi:TerB family tellurite resistance protein [Sulfitobacter sp. JBTF-M27]|uniref:TerB family tellurite resistance protein n=1 Tax=Sulfitobacter sediminilitoris TaxID=2698830 RepID=A0A6P0CEQ8_9RHOB|nr:TerB family tellurite resistance protein [Sulfitobacter sediminilitoris]NEK24669.1 TerB family tellurite resistance protein [Sulfitobacter sediminilitoris]
MFGDFLRRLTEPDPAPFADDDARLALTALLVRVAKSDHDYATSEARLIEDIASARYGLSSADARELRSQGEALEAEAPDTVRFTRAIKDAVPYEERLGVIEALWKVVLADGTRTDEENALLRLVANLLGVTDTDSAMARQRVDG